MPRLPLVADRPPSRPGGAPARHAVALLAVVVLALFGLAGCGDSGDAASPDTTAARDADGRPIASAGEAAPPLYTFVTATAAGAVPFYAAAGDTEAAGTIENPTEYGVPAVFLVEQDLGDWLEVSLPMRPNGSTGWVRAAGLERGTTYQRVEVDLSEYRLRVFDREEVVLEVPVGLAQDSYPTPTGRYYLTEFLQPPDPDTAYGIYAYGLSGYSDTLEEFNGGDGQLGIHGTNKPESIGKNESHGCIRLLNEDIQRVVDLGLLLGTPVDIVA